MDIGRFVSPMVNGPEAIFKAVALAVWRSRTPNRPVPTVAATSRALGFGAKGSVRRANSGFKTQEAS